MSLDTSTMNIIKNITSNVNDNLDHVVNRVKELLKEGAMDTNEFWLLRDGDSKVSAVIQGNLSCALLKMDAHLTDYKNGIIHKWIQGYADKFEKEVEEYARSCKSHEEYIDVKEELEYAFNLENTAISFCDKICDSMEDNTYLTPIKKL